MADTEHGIELMVLEIFSHRGAELKATRGQRNEARLGVSAESISESLLYSTLITKISGWAAKQATGWARSSKRTVR